MENIDKEHTNFLEKVISDNKRKPYPKNNSAIREIATAFETETLYFGKRTKNNGLLVRIYDKKKERGIL